MRPSSASSSLPPATPRPRERSDVETLASLFPYLWEFRWRVLVAITCLVAAKVAVVGVPVVLGSGGVERIIELKLLPDERAALDKSIAAVKELVGVMDRLTGHKPA